MLGDHTTSLLRFPLQIPIPMNHPSLWLNSGDECVPSPSVIGKLKLVFNSSDKVVSKSPHL